MSVVVDVCVAVAAVGETGEQTHMIAAKHLTDFADVLVSAAAAFASVESHSASVVSVSSSPSSVPMSDHRGSDFGSAS